MVRVLVSHDGQAVTAKTLRYRLRRGDTTVVHKCAMPHEIDRAPKTALVVSHLGPDVFIDILPDSLDWLWHVRAYVANGEIIVGWMSRLRDDIEIHNYDRLFDGRFNAEKACE